MAFLIASKTTSSGIVVENIYAKITSLTGDKTILDVSLSYYVSKESPKPFLTEHLFFKPSVEEDSFNYHKQGYLYAKTQPEFADAVDC